MNILTPNQLMMINHQKVSPESVKYNLGGFVALKIDLNLEKFRSAIKSVLDSNIEMKQKIILDGTDYRFSDVEKEEYIEFVDFTMLDLSLESLTDYFKKEMQRPFRIFDNQLSKFLLIKLSSKEYYWFAKIHHIISDGWSFNVLFNSVMKFYFEGPNTSNKQSNISKSKLGIEDFKKSSREKIYWKKATKNVSQSIFYEFARDTNLFDLAYFPMTTLKYRFPIEIFNEALKIKVNSSSSLNHVLLTIVAVYFSKLLSKENICINVPIHNRNLGNRNKIGLYMNNLPLFFSDMSNQTIGELIVGVRRKLYEAIRYGSYPSAMISENSDSTNHKYSNLRDILFSFEEINYADHEKNIEPEVISSGHADVFLSFHFRFIKNLKILTVEIDFCTSIFKKEDIESFMDFLSDFFSDFENTLSFKVKELGILADNSVDRLSNEIEKKINYTESTDVFDLVLFHVETSPNSPAIISKDSVVTYDDLRKYVEIICDFFDKNDLGPTSIIPFISTNSWLTPIFLLSCLKRKICYVPIDSTTPMKRISLILDELGVDFLLTDYDLYRESTDELISRQIIDLKDIINDEIIYSVRSNSIINDEAVAYIIFTSGSTGVPKGVKIGPNALNTFFSNLLSSFGFFDQVSSISLTNFSFDISLIELLLPLITGGNIIVPQSTMGMRRWDDILCQVKERKPTFIQATPTMWRLLIESNVDISSETILFVGGENFNEDLKNSLLSFSPHVFNLYGPSEATIWVTSSILKLDNPVNIGKGFGNNVCLVADKEGNPLPSGSIGELVIGGGQVSLGYWRRDEENYNKFFILNLKNKFMGKFYRTGDRVMDKNGSLTFLGRFDDQIKVNGYRVELQDLEAAVNKLVGIKQSKVIFTRDNDYRSTLVLFIESEEVNENVVFEHLRRSIPNYMLPSRIIRIAEFPLNTNGKIDKGNLEILFKQYQNIDNDVDRMRQEESLLDFCRAILGDADLETTDNLLEHGLNSMGATYIRQFLLERWGITIDFKLIYNLASVEKIENMLNDKMEDGQSIIEI
jgi:surfactin family lipopeptide synthetase A